VEQFKGGLRVGNVVERLVYAHDHQLEALEEAAMAFIEENALLFQMDAMSTLSVLGQSRHHLLLVVTGLLASGLASAVHGRAGAVGSEGAVGSASLS
jgi:hypothetical protein